MGKETFTNIAQDIKSQINDSYKILYNLNLQRDNLDIQILGMQNSINEKQSQLKIIIDTYNVDIEEPPANMQEYIDIINKPLIVEGEEPIDDKDN